MNQNKKINDIKTNLNFISQKFQVMPPPFCKKTLFLFIVALFAFGSSKAQQQNYRGGVHLGEYIHGYWEYLPQSYSPNSSKKFPLIIFINGTGVAGDGSEQSMRSKNIVGAAYGPPYRITSDAAFPKSFTNPAGETFEFVVICPQWTTEPWLHVDPVTKKVDSIWIKGINDMIDTLLKNYNIDKDRIYLTGQSMGSGYIITYLGASLSNSKRIAAAMIASPNYKIDSLGGVNISKGKTPIWFACAEADKKPSFDAEEYVNDNVNTILNAVPYPDYPPQVTIITLQQNPNASHGSACNYLFDQRNTTNGLNAYQWALQFDKMTALPITQLQVSARVTGSAILIQWSAQSENNSSLYSIERSNDSKTFSDLATQPSHNSSMGSSYSFVDGSPIKGTGYYRIKHTDKDGKMTYSKIVAVEYKENASIKIYPNPVGGILTIEVPVSNIRSGQVRIFNSEGKLFKEISTNGTSVQKLDVSSFPKGVYSGKIVLGNQEFNFQFLKQ